MGNAMMTQFVKQATKMSGVKGMKGNPGNFKDIPMLTEYLANNPTFQKVSLNVHKGFNSQMTTFQSYLHEAAFPEDAPKKEMKETQRIKDNQNNKKK